jgi:hypothetical protein
MRLKSPPIAYAWTEREALSRYDTMQNIPLSRVRLARLAPQAQAGADTCIASRLDTRSNWASRSHCRCDYGALSGQDFVNVSMEVIP